MTDRTPFWRSGLASRNRRAIGPLFAAVLALAVVADAQTLPSTRAPAAIEVRAEAVAAFDVRDPRAANSGCSNSAAVWRCVRPTRTSAACRPFASLPMARTSLR